MGGRRNQQPYHRSEQQVTVCVSICHQNGSRVEHARAQVGHESAQRTPMIHDLGLKKLLWGMSGVVLEGFPEELVGAHQAFLAMTKQNTRSHAGDALRCARDERCLAHSCLTGDKQHLHASVEHPVERVVDSG